MSFLLELRETARVCPRPLTAKLLRDAADELAAALTALNDDPTKDAMQRVNGAWAHAMRVLDTAPPIGGDGTAGGKLPVPQMRAAA